MKILCTGNPSKKTVANGIQKIFPEADFVYASNGYDFLSQEGLNKFRNKVKDFDIFINASRIDLGVQSKLLDIVKDTWEQGHVFNIGSVLEYDFFNYLDPAVAKDKLFLRSQSLQLCNQKFRTTHIIMGGCKDQSENSDNKMDPIHVAKTIKWILDNQDIYVPIIGIENDYWNNDWQLYKNRGIDGIRR